MNKEQIEEMAKSVCRTPNCKMIVCADLKEETTQPCDKRCRAYIYAERFYNAGYRKASEVAREIFGEIDKILVRPKAPTTLFYHCSKHNYNELKKKYTEGGK